MSVKRTLNRGSSAPIAVAVSSLSDTSTNDAHKRPERGAGREITPMGIEVGGDDRRAFWGAATVPLIVKIMRGRAEGLPVPGKVGCVR